jgi:hypothetical protein
MLNVIARAVVEQIVNDRKSRTICVKPIPADMPRHILPEKRIMVDSVAFDQHIHAASTQNRTCWPPIVNPIMPNGKVVRVMELNGIVAITYLKPLDRNPTDPLVTTGIVLQ